jgi:hypothetical protein
VDEGGRHESKSSGEGKSELAGADRLAETHVKRLASAGLTATFHFSIDVASSYSLALGARLALSAQTLSYPPTIHALVVCTVENRAIYDVQHLHLGLEELGHAVMAEQLPI